jgi:hypothetical protein
MWKKNLRNILYDKKDKDFELHVRENFSNLPDYIYEEYHKKFIEESDFLSCIDNIADYFLEFNIHKKTVFVKKEKMEEWQGLISIISPIPFISNILYKHNSMSSTNIASILPILDFNEILDYKLNGLHDLHIHINGTSETFYSWQKALSNPKEFLNAYNDQIHNKNSLEKLLSQDMTTMDDFFDMLETAKTVREMLILYMLRKLDTETIELKNFVGNIKKYNNNELKYSETHPYKEISSEKYSSYYYEIKMWIDLFKLSVIPVKIEKLIHFYILAQSQFERVLVQQTSQNGFRQFLYISDNMVRDGYEDLGYKDRFKQLNSHTYQKKLNLEIRITPGGFCKKFQKIIKNYTELSIDKDGYKKEIDSTKYKLSVVCHFIKFENPKYIEYISVEKYAYTKSKVLEQASALLGCLLPALSNTVNTKSLSDFFVGIDAAGYELYAPPEAFAPTFRMIRARLYEYNKKIGITFHAGEDFTHILSGIRYIYEAYTFIDYQEGDRIGHANALGLDPKKWREKLNNILTVKQGEWLDDLILFAVKTKTTDKKLLNKIKEYWIEVYNYELEVTEILHIGYKAYSMRKYAFNSDESLVYLDSLELINTDKNKVLKIYEDYLFNVHSSYDKFIEVPLEEKFDKYIVGLQDLILMEMSQKGIIIESMISSNVRISFYERYKEHHIIKWLDKKHNMPLVTLASDDPGIFNNNILAEYAHLYEMLDYDDNKFEEYIEILKINGEKASFAENTLVNSI